MILEGIYDADGALIDETTNDDISVGDMPNSRLVFMPTADDTYYVAAAVWGPGGTYKLSVTEVKVRTEEGDADFAETTSTLGRVEVGASATQHQHRN